MNPFKVGDYVCWKDEKGWERYCQASGYVFKPAYKIVKIKDYRLFFKEKSGSDSWHWDCFKKAKAPSSRPLEHYLKTE
jgi:hypothetical protein